MNEHTNPVKWEQAFREMLAEMALMQAKIERQAAEIERLRGALLDIFTVQATNIEKHVYKIACDALKGGTA